MSKIEPKSIAQLEGYKFFVPLYQRGYRWSIQQVRDLIDDISEFISIGQKGIYCIQPLVVRYGDEGWHIIDGQQRLTTINILLSCLGLHVFDLSYQTRQKSEAFLKNIIGETEEDSQRTSTSTTCSKRAGLTSQCWTVRMKNGRKLSRMSCSTRSSSSGMTLTNRTQ